MDQSSLKSLFILVLPHLVLSHTWNEQLVVIRNGLYTGENGYPRGYVSRSEPGFMDKMMTYLIPSPDSGRTEIIDSDLLCSVTQRITNQTENYPRLQALAGDYLSIKYLENGHITLPQGIPGKPAAAGTVYLFSTDHPNEDEKLAEVLKWTKDGTGGDQRGLLLAVQNFDDGRCYQINDGETSTDRQKWFPNPTPGQPESRNEQWCETNAKLPSILSAESSLTIYWVWQWPTEPGTQGSESGKDEYYTTCSDINIIANVIQGAPQNPLKQQDPQIAAVPSYQSRTTNGGSTPTGLTPSRVRRSRHFE